MRPQGPAARGGGVGTVSSHCGAREAGWSVARGPVLCLPGTRGAPEIRTGRLGSTDCVPGSRGSPLLWRRRITATVGTGKRAQRGHPAGPCLSKKPCPDATSASQVPLLPAKAFGCLLIVLGLRPPPHQVWETWLPVSSLSSEAPPTAEPPKDGHSPRSSCSDQGKSRQARLPNGACWAVSWRGL